MVELTKDTFEAEVLNAKGKVLVDFWSPSCEPCKQLLPHVHAFEDHYKEHVKFTSLDITKARRIAIGQKVMGLPAIALYENGERIKQLSGHDASVQSVQELLETLI